MESLIADPLDYSYGDLSSNNKKNSTFILKDLNNDGRIEFLAFGDSITRGVGDFFEPGEFIPVVDFLPQGEAGYPLRIETWLNIPVANSGRPGERLSITGVTRFATNILNSNADYVIISEGVNDGFFLYGDTSLARDLQALINMTRASGREAILMTIPPPCCNRSGLRLPVESYNVRYRDLAAVNQVLLADSDRAYQSMCTEKKCSLLNMPEGLHPNRKGYDVMGELFAALFYGIDLFAPGGTSLLAGALGFSEDSLIIKSPPAATTGEAATSRLETPDFGFSMYDPFDYISVRDY